MIRLLFSLVADLLLGRRMWILPAFISLPPRLLYEKARALSTIVAGRHGTGKTFAVGKEQVEQMKAHPEQPFFIFDWSGGLVITILLLILSDPKRDELLPRLVYDSMGGRTINGKRYIIPMPEFSEKYDPEKPWLERIEDQVDRVQRVFTELNAELIERNPTMYGRPINDLLPNLLSLVNAVTDENGKSFQITEAVKLLNNEVRESARKLFGYKVGKANEYFGQLSKGESKLEKDIAQALIDILDVIKTQRIRARVGTSGPAWTPSEAIQKGLIVLCDGSALNNNHRQKDYAFLQLFFLIYDELNKRVPSAPGYPPINWVMDEVYTFTEIKGVAKMLTHFVTEYRNRLLHFTLVIQSLKQLPGESNGITGLRDMFFSFGNIVVFSLLDIDDCMAVAKNFFPFDPQLVKVPAKREEQHDIMQNRDEQIAVKAYQLQHLEKRECYVRRFVDEGRMDRVVHIGKTPEARITATYEDVEQLKDKLILERGVPLEEAERLINKRKITPINQENGQNNQSEKSKQTKQSGKQKKQRKPEGV